MKDSSVNVPKKSNLKFKVKVSDISNLSSYTATLTVKETAQSTDPKFTVESTDVTDDTITISVDYSKNDITPKAYVYGISITDGTYRYTLDLGDGTVPKTVGTYNVLPTV